MFLPLEVGTKEGDLDYGIYTRLWGVQKPANIIQRRQLFIVSLRWY